jgi:hypothetical protein
MGLLAAFNGQLLWPGSGMAWLATPLAATAFSWNARFEALAVAGGWFGRVARIAADALPQAGQLGSQGGELLTHLCILLTQHPNLPLLRKDQRPDTGWRRQPVSTASCWSGIWIWREWCVPASLNGCNGVGLAMGLSPASALARSNLKTTGTPSSRSKFDSEIGAERCAGSWYQQAGQLPQLASFVCHTSIRERTGHSHNSGIDGPQGSKNNNDVYARSQSRTIGRRQPGRFPVKKRKRAADVTGSIYNPNQATVLSLRPNAPHALWSKLPASHRPLRPAKAPTAERISYLPIERSKDQNSQIAHLELQACLRLIWSSNPGCVSYRTCGYRTREPLLSLAERRQGALHCNGFRASSPMLQCGLRKRRGARGVVLRTTHERVGRAAVDSFPDIIYT